MPADPRPAATLILLRRGGKHAERGVEVLMVRRSEQASFMPGVWVFPGGAVEERDRVRVAGADDDGRASANQAAGASDMDGASEADDRAHRACAIRELREEAGIELGDDAELRPWSRWITPEVVSVRFDTRFYVALAPPHSRPTPDEAEVSAADWFSPRAALDAHACGQMSLVFPTIRNLEMLIGHATSEEVMEAALGLAVEPILPIVVGTREEHRVLMPGEAGYEEAAGG